MAAIFYLCESKPENAWHRGASMYEASGVQWPRRLSWGFPRRELYKIPFRWSPRNGDAETLRGLEIE